jgi:uncharacterized protein YndB with AHSA1/START domain
MPRTDRVSRVVDAPVERVFAALVDRTALQTWLAPEGMTARFERFEPVTGGSYRLVLTYTDASTSPGKTSADADVVEARYREIVPGVRVVQEIDFVSDDPAFSGTMTMTWSVCETPAGTRVEFVADDVPTGISAEDHDAGMTSSLDNLARFLG